GLALIVWREDRGSGFSSTLHLCWPVCRRFHRPLPRLLFGCHVVDPPLQGKTTVIFVPLPRKLVIFNSPPICSTRSRIPVRPTPSCRSLTLNPSPSSRSSRRRCFVLQLNRVSKLCGCAYLSALVNASCPMCIRFSCQTCDNSGSLPRSAKLV